MGYNNYYDPQSPTSLSLKCLFVQRSRIFAGHFSKREERERERVGEKEKERENGLSLSLSEGSVFEKEQKRPFVKSRFFLSFKNRFVFVFLRGLFLKKSHIFVVYFCKS